MSDDQDRDEQLAPEESPPSSDPSSQFPEPPEWNYERKQAEPPSPGSNKYAGIANGIRFAYLLVGPMVGGWVIGLLIEKNTEVKDAQMWGLIVGIGLGLFTVMFMLNHEEQKTKK